MKAADIARLVALAAIWGGSFIFMRVLAPVLGPIVTAELRVAIAGLALLAYYRLTGFDMQWRAYWKQYLVIGAVNSAIPFFLFSFAALHIPASYSVILNSSTPLWAAVFSALWLGEWLSAKRIIGLFVGAAGVFLVANVKPANVDSFFVLAVLACLLATCCYGLSAVFMKVKARGANPRAIAGASQIMAAAVLMPALPVFPLHGEFSWFIVGNVLGLALLCSAVAYLFYYRLIADLGPTKALSVTFLMPMFGMLWGYLFLHEQITSTMILGTLLILAGTSLILNLFGVGAKSPQLPTKSIQQVPK